MKKYFENIPPLQLFIYLISIILLSVGGYTYISRSDFNHAKSEYLNKLSDESAKLDSELSDKQAKVKRQFEERNQDSNDVIISSGLKQNQAIRALRKKTEKAFKIIMTYDNGKEYAKRKEKIKPLVSDEVLNSSLFASDIDDSGMSYVDVMKIHTHFLESSVGVSALTDPENIVVLANISYDSWYGDRYSNNYRPKITRIGRNVDLWRLTYNSNTGKFTSIKRMSRLNRTTNVEEH